MKHLYLIFLFICSYCIAYAVPAKRGIWNTIKLADGKTVLAELCGDEFCHYWRADDGQCFVQKANTNLYEKVELSSFIQKTAAKRSAIMESRVKRSPMMQSAKSGQKIAYTGEKKGLIILLEFADMPFQETHTRDLYEQIANAANFSNDMGFRGSVRDYFYDQSYGQFILDFDVVGPIRMPQGYAYYGGNVNGGDNGKVIGQMVKDACIAANEQYDINFADYDWNKDGDVDQVFILYAGHGEASYPDPNTIWPHEWTLESALAQTNDDGYVIAWGEKLEVDGVYVNTYACGCELGPNGDIDGIGTICHEFSHCLGLPDMYDTQGNGFGLGHWSLMSAGNYNSGSFVPAGYTAYERMYAGWLNPVELRENQEITGMKGICSNPEAYIIYNDGNKNEYYLLENHDGTKWDDGLPGEGMLITHVDYNLNVWNKNIVNSVTGQRSSGLANPHDRCSIIPAANRMTDTSGDLWPYNFITSLTNTSLPAAEVYNRNSDGTYFMNKPIRNITKNDDGTISFMFGEDVQSYIFNETFDQCKNKGGNDGVFNGMSTGSVTYDNEGWDANTATAAYLCARFGTKNNPGQATTPNIEIDGEHEFSFRVAPFTGQAKSLTVEVVSGNATLSQSNFNLEEGAWVICKTTVTGNGPIRLCLKADNGMFFLDDVCMKSAGGVSAIEGVTNNIHNISNNQIYSIDGRYVGTNVNTLPKGIYIKNGKKFVK